MNAARTGEWTAYPSRRSAPAAAAPHCGQPRQDGGQPRQDGGQARRDGGHPRHGGGDGQDGGHRPDCGQPLWASLQTDDLDEARGFCRALYYYPLSLQPLGRLDGFAFSGDVVRVGPITIGEISYGTDMQVTSGDLEIAYHVLTPLSGVLQSRHRTGQIAVTPRLASLYRPVGDIEVTWPGDCRTLSVKIERAALEQEVATALGRPPTGPLPLGACLDVTNGPGRSWTALVRLLYAELRNPDSLVRQPHMARRWWQLVLSGLALTLEHPDQEDLPATTLRPRPVKRALDAMHADPAHPFTAPELAGIAGVGTRVLQESFRRHVGRPPLTYLRELRLARVHEELSRSDPWQTNVSDVAYRWGFAHLGRFAGAYRARYGVPPSQTLRAQR